MRVVKFNKYNIYQICMFILYISLLIVFCYFCLQNGDKSFESSFEVSEIISNGIESITGNNPMENEPEKFNAFIRKFIGHFVYFILIGITSNLYYLSLNKIKLWVRLALHFSIGLAFTLFSEFVLENLSANRTASFKDVCIDFGGLLLGSMFVIIGYIIYRQKRKALCKK